MNEAAPGRTNVENFGVDHWWGVVAAVGCGLGMRYFPQIIGTGGVAGVAAVVAVCVLTLVDGAAS